jgi:hypothetical protein
MLVLVTLLVIAVYYVPLGHVDYLDNWREGTYGFALAQNSPVIADVIDSKLLADGVRPGDRLVTSLYSMDYARAQFPRAGDRVTLHFLTKSGLRTETLTAYRPVQFDAWTRLAGIAAILPGTVFLIVAVMLVFIRPGVMTWMFYIFAVGYFGTKPSIAYFDFLPEPIYRAMMFVLGTLFSNFAAVPLVQFVLRFPDNDTNSGWRKTANVLAWVYVLGTYALYVDNWFVLSRTGEQIAWLAPWLSNWIPLSAFAFSAVLLVKKFKSAPPEIRQRMVWLILGMVISFIAYAVYFIPDFPDNWAQIIGFAAVLMPTSVAYAVFQYRVIDVNFVINRAIVYGALTILLAAAVSLLDWLLGKILGGAHFTTAAEALITIGLGFALNRLHHTFEDWVDRFLFWRRHRAETYIRRVAAALPFATADEAITDGVVYEPVEALDLTGAALYRSALDSPHFDFVAAWRASPMSGRFDSNDNLVRFLQSEEKIVWLSELGTKGENRTGVFVIAVPIRVRHQIIAFTLYGSHRNGAQLDPDEVRLLEELAIEAARAYDHVEAVRTREQMELMQRKLERLGVNPQAAN